MSLRKWRLFRLLLEKQGEIVSLGQIQQETEMSKRAVQNVVARLRQRELRGVNIEIVNEREKGYRLVVSTSSV
jgi:biotin operon repressor